ncbi:hypothetical protein CIK96_09445 [Prevotella sp. P4-98]|nr:hypothetical protein CIK96_09445 [Prevotella sp. P4-98]
MKMGKGRMLMIMFVLLMHHSIMAQTTAERNGMETMRRDSIEVSHNDSIKMGKINVEMPMGPLIRRTLERMTHSGRRHGPIIMPNTNF